jgi:hypothetical protein
MVIAFNKFYVSPAIPCQCFYIWHRREEQQVMLNFVRVPERRPSALLRPRLSPQRQSQNGHTTAPPRGSPDSEEN